MDKVHITTGSGKLEGISSINTSTLSNEYCSKMRVTDSVCGKCYAARYERLRPNISIAFERNAFLSKRIIDDREIPYINAQEFRFHSYGELINSVHLSNYVLIAEANPRTIFSIWTKRKNLVTRVFNKLTKPSNLIVIYSSPRIDRVEMLPRFFDKVFTAFTKGIIDNINCHSKCTECKLCYTHNDTVFINEEIK